MILLLTPFALSLAGLALTVFSLERKASGPSGEIYIGAFGGKMERVAKTFFWQVFRVLFPVAILLSAALLAVPDFSAEAAIAFLFGVLASFLVVYYALRLILRLQTRVLESSDRGPIQTFHTAFNGGSLLGIFVIAGVVFFLSGYYLVVKEPSALALVSFAFGSVLVTLMYKLGGSIYARVLPEASDEPVSDTGKNPETLAIFAKNYIGDSLGAVLGAFEIALIGVVGTMLATGLAVPGAGNALVFALLLFAAGFAASGLSILLLRFGATTNINKNIVFSFVGLVLLASIVVVPALLWVLGAAVQQYPLLYLWIAVFIGYATAALTAISMFLPVLKKAKGHLWTAASLVVFVLFAAVSYWLAEFYGFALSVGAFASSVGAISALAIFYNFANVGKNISQYLEMPEERQNVFNKLASIPREEKMNTAPYFSFAVAAFALLYFVIYQIELSTRSVELVFSLDNADLFFGTILGAAAIMFSAYMLDFLRTRMRRVFLEEKPQETASQEGSDVDHPIKQKKRWIYVRFAGTITNSVWRDVGLFFLFTIGFPVLVGVLGGAEVFRGFLLGFIATGLVGILAGIFDKKEEYTYSDTDAIVASSIRVVGLIALFLVIFFVK